MQSCYNSKGYTYFEIIKGLNPLVVLNESTHVGILKYVYPFGIPT